MKLVVQLDPLIQSWVGKVKVDVRSVNRMFFRVLGTRIICLAGLLALLRFHGSLLVGLVLVCLWVTAEAILLAVAVWVWLIEPCLVTEHESDLVTYVGVFATQLVSVVCVFVFGADVVTAAKYLW